MAASKYSIAVLDDYLGIMPDSFAHISNLTLKSFPKTLNPRKPDDSATLVEQLKPFPIISTMRERTPFPAEIVSKLPNLKLLLTTGPRNASIDLAAATSAGIAVTGTTGAGTSMPKAPPLLKTTYDYTSQHTWALILALAANIPQDDLTLKTVPGSWQTGFAMHLAGKTFGAVGLGRLGSRTARSAILGFGMKVVTWSSNLTQEKADQAAMEASLPAGSFRVVRKEELFDEADVVSVHYVLSERSRGIVGKEELARMKSTALLVNTARGPLVDEEALFEVLETGKIKGAALDVFDTEPLEEDSPWRNTEWGKKGRSDVILSPHMGYVVEDILRAWYDEQAEIVESWIKGEKLAKRLN